MTSLALLFLVVFALNILPAFAPPTWMVISYVGLRHAEDGNTWVIALVAAVAATAGRVVLARFARRIVAAGWFAAGMRDNLAHVAKAIERRKTASVVGFLLFAFSPLPSNVLFLAYGMTRAPLLLLVAPFFIGRFVSYALAYTGGALASRWLEPELDSPIGWMYFVATQLLCLGLVYAFAKIDWRASAKARRLRWVT